MTHTNNTPQSTDERKGTVAVRDYPPVRIHSYASPADGFLVNTQIVEGEAALVIFDGQLLNAYAAEVATYASSLGKPVEQIIVSHAHPDHWAGLEVLTERFPTASIVALPGVAEAIRVGGEAMLAGLRRVFGDLVATRPTIPTGTLTVGTHTIAGVPFEFREVLDGESDVQLLALLPEQKALLAFDLIFAPQDHVFTVAGHFDHWISRLDGLQDIEGYDTILIGHDGLTDRSGFDATKAYLRNARECYAQALDGPSYAAALKATFPDRLQPGWVDFSGRVLFSTPRRELPSADRARKEEKQGTESEVRDTPLTWDVFVTPGIPTETLDLPPGIAQRMWSPISATLISGRRDAVLVDALLTVEQVDALVEWVEAHGKNLTTIYLTHGHGDHFFGLGALLDRFPKARAVATPAVVKFMHQQASPAVVANFWNGRFPGQIPDRLVIAEELKGRVIDLEGHDLVVIEVGHSDTDDTTCLHVPSIGLVVAGDVAYNDVHLYLAESNAHTRREWISALDTIESLHPRAVIAGHKRAGTDDDPRIFAETRQYIRDFDRLAETTTTRELYDQMLSLYPDRVNPGALWSSARAIKG
ncbi:MAG TPA: MBL fold metallo-hydrolase [Nitrospiraceae bacterium]